MSVKTETSVPENRAHYDEHPQLTEREYEAVSYSIIKARIGMLATAIGGPDHSVESPSPPYKMGDDCLACIKDLIRWFKLVDDNQKRWDVEMATAEFQILQNDLIPILLGWEAQSSAAVKKSKKTGEDVSKFFPNKAYYDRIALGVLQLMVLMTWPLIITDQSSFNQVNHYFELKKHQLIYKHAILTSENGKVLKAAIRLALNVMRMEKNERTARDESLIRMVLHFLKNVVAIEPGEVTLSSVKRLRQPLTASEMLPANISFDDVSLDTVIGAFVKNKVFDFILTVSSTLLDSIDEEFVNFPLLELLFFLTKDINSEHLFKKVNTSYQLGTNLELSNSNMTPTGMQLSELLSKEHEKKVNVIKHTSSRHSRFGGLLSIQTPQHTRLTVPSNSVNMRDDAALYELDARKKWNKSVRMKLDLIEGLSSSFLNTDETVSHISSNNLNYIKEFLINFVDSSFNLLLKEVTDSFTSDIQDQISLHKIEYMLFVSWFVKFQRIRCENDPDSSFDCISKSLVDECFILFTKYLRESYEQKNWPVVHAGMTLFTNYLSMLLALDASWENDVYFVMSKILSENMLHLLASLPKSATSHSSQYVKSCIHLTHVVLKVLDKFAENQALTVESKRKRKVNLNHKRIENYAKEHGIDYEEAFDILENEFKQVSVNYDKVFSSYLSEMTISTYIKYLQSFKELGETDIMMVLKFFQRVFVKAEEEMLLYRMDFLILSREILSQYGLSSTSKTRRLFSEFIDFFLRRMKKKLEAVPSLYVNILFPMLHDSQISYYLKTGTVKKPDAEYDIVNPSVFINIEEDSLPKEALHDMKIGILVSALLDDGYDELVESLITNLRDVLRVIQEEEPLTVEQTPGSEEKTPLRIIYTSAHNEIKRALYQHPDFRRLLLITGYAIPDEQHPECYFVIKRDIQSIQTDIDTIKKYQTLPFESSSEHPAHYYLTSHNEVSDLSYDNTTDVENEEYFKDLETMNDKINGRDLTKGTAKSKKIKKSSSKRQKIKKQGYDHPENSDLQATSLPTKGKSIVSKEYIGESEDEDPQFSSIFFENEKALRELLDTHNGVLTSEQYERFNEYCAEKINNKGAVHNNYDDLFEKSPNLQSSSEGITLRANLEGSSGQLDTQQLLSQELSSDEYNSSSEGIRKHKRAVIHSDSDN